jgi:L-fuconolactonase
LPHELVTGIEANSISSRWTDSSLRNVRACVGIVGYADLRLGEAAKPVLEAQIGAGGG